MTSKLLKSEVNYRLAKNGSSTRCGNCSMFRKATGSCTLVRGDIVAKAVCDRFEEKGPK